MLAVVFENNKLALQEIAVPTVLPGEALIRTLKAGICNTDLEIVKGYMGFNGVLGHEFVGEVVEMHPSVPSKVAEQFLHQRVVGEINCGCGHCTLCAQQDPRHCHRRTTLGIAGRPGVFAEYFTLPVRNLLRVPTGVETDAAVFVEPLAAAMEILEQVHISPHERVAVLGDGKLGLLCAQALHMTGCHLTLVGKHQENLNLLSQLGCCKGIHICLLSDWQARGNLDLVVEATGNPSGLVCALQSVRPCGTVVLKSTFADTVHLDFAPIVVNEIKLVGSRCGRFAPALRALRQKKVTPQACITAHYPLAQALPAFAQAAKRGSLKVLLDAADCD